MPLTVTSEHRPDGGYVILKPEGSVDASTHPILAKEVEAAHQKSPRLIIFDMARVDFLSSAGIGVVLGAEKTLKKSGGKALVVNPKPQIKRIFDVVQALPQDQLFSSLAELTKYLAEKHGDGQAGKTNPPGSTEVRIKNRITELDALAAGLEKFCLSGGMTPDETAEVRLAVEEAVSNTIRHGYVDDQPHDIVVRAAIEGGRLKLEIEDDAKAFDPLASPLPDLTLPVEEKPIGGLGILLVRTIADSVEYKREGNRNLLRIGRWI